MRAYPTLAQVPGWELALPLMRVGESARLVCAPSYAFGEQGKPPRIPPNSKVTFELEMLAVRDIMSSNNTEEVSKRTRAVAAPSVDCARLRLTRTLLPTRTPQVDLADRYAGMMADLETSRTIETQAAVPLRESDEEDEPGDGWPSPPENAGELQENYASTAAAGPSADGTPSPADPRLRTWIPSATRVEVEHPDGYGWRETDDEIEMRIPLPDGTAKSDLSIDIQSSFLRVAISGVPKIEGRLSELPERPDRARASLPLTLSPRTAQVPHRPLLVPAAWTDGRLVVDECAWSIVPPGEEGEASQLQLDLMKSQSAEKALWGYVLASEKQAAEGFTNDMDEESF